MTRQSTHCPCHDGVLCWTSGPSQASPHEQTRGACVPRRGEGQGQTTTKVRAQASAGRVHCSGDGDSARVPAHFARRTGRCSASELLLERHRPFTSYRGRSPLSVAPSPAHGPRRYVAVGPFMSAPELLLARPAPTRSLGQSCFVCIPQLTLTEAATMSAFLSLIAGSPILSTSTPFLSPGTAARSRCLRLFTPDLTQRTGSSVAMPVFAPLLVPSACAICRCPSFAVCSYGRRQTTRNVHEQETSAMTKHDCRLTSAFRFMGDSVSFTPCFHPIRRTLLPFTNTPLRSVCVHPLLITSFTPLVQRPCSAPSSASSSLRFAVPGRHTTPIASSTAQHLAPRTSPSRHCIICLCYRRMVLHRH